MIRKIYYKTDNRKQKSENKNRKSMVELELEELGEEILRSSDGEEEAEL